MRRRQTLVGAGVAAVLAGVVFAGTQLVPGDSAERSGALDSTPAAVVDPGVVESAPGQGYQVAYGAGGSTTSPHGVPVGYEPDCAAAAAAAAAYAVAVVTPTVAPQGWDADRYAGLLEDLSGGLHTDAGDQARAHLMDVLAAAPAVVQTVTDTAVYPTDSLFRVRSCQPATAASVDLALVTGGMAVDVPFGGVMPVSVDLAWHGQDWRLVRLDPFAQWDGWQEMNTAPGQGWLPPLGSTGRDLVAAAGGPGWTEFTNAAG
jgi:hypothetical protein